MKCEHDVHGYCYAGQGCVKCDHQNNVRSCATFKLSFENDDVDDITLCEEFCMQLSKKYRFEYTNDPFSFCKTLQHAASLGLKLERIDADRIAMIVTRRNEL